MDNHLKHQQSASQPQLSHALKLIAVGTLLLAAFVLVFGLGAWVGEERAQFSFEWAENYHRNFAGPAGGFFGNFPVGDYTNGHGVFGSIIKIDGNTLIIEDHDNVEKTVTISSQTLLRNNTKTISLSQLKVGDVIVVIGQPDNQGQISAKFIRVMPSGTTALLMLQKLYES